MLLSDRDRPPAGLLNAQALLNKAAEAAADLELQLPPLNAPLVLQRSLIELGMPQVSIHTTCTALCPASKHLAVHQVTDTADHATPMSVLLHQACLTGSDLCVHVGPVSVFLLSLPLPH